MMMVLGTPISIADPCLPHLERVATKDLDQIHWPTSIRTGKKRVTDFCWSHRFPVDLFCHMWLLHIRVSWRHKLKAYTDCTSCCTKRCNGTSSSTITSRLHHPSILTSANSFCGSSKGSTKSWNCFLTAVPIHSTNASLTWWFTLSKPTLC